MTSAGPHVGLSGSDMSLATADLIHSYAMPLLIVGAILILAGVIGVVISDGVRGRYAAQALKIASLRTASLQTAGFRTPGARLTNRESAPSKPATPPAAAVIPTAPSFGGTTVQAQMMTATAAQTVASPSAGPAANTIQEGGDATAPAPQPPKLAARSLNAKQRASMVDALRGAAEDIWFVTERDPEARHFADQLGDVFREAGWTDHHALVLHPGQPIQGVSAALKATSADRSVSRAFAAAGLPLTFREKSGDEPVPTVYVGRPDAAP